ncbi:MAG: hypothetical protein J0H39_01950 [Alphaproteobacteria bacterium]|nr:hypothetical protein [Alphaproteobacteria bacterium]
MVGNAVLVVVSLIFALGLGEGAARILGYTPYAPAAPSAEEFRWSGPDLDFGWVNKPGRFLSAEPGNVPMNFDANGLRAMPPLKTATPRIDVVGDSITQGYAVADDETFAWRLAEMRPDLAIVNLGVGGYGTYQALLRMEARRDDPPALFVYGFYGDHQYRNVAHLGWVRSLRDGDGHNMVPPHATIENGALRFHRGGSILPWPFESASVVVTEAHRAWLRLQFRARQDQRQAVLEALLARMKTTAEAQRAKFVVLLLADAPNFLPPYLARENVVVADCRKPEFETDPKLRVGGWGHPTAARHALWAECLAPVIDAALKN